MNGTEPPIDAVLFTRGTEFDEKARDRLFEQYKIMVQTSETLVGRRQNVNTFFLSINTLLLTAVGLAVREDIAAKVGNSDVLLTLLGLAGLLLAIAWRRLVKSYRQLNAGKFKVIHLLEKQLPASIFDAEWVALGSGRDKSKYTPSTATEISVPWIFGALYAASMLHGLVGFQRILPKLL